jgi:hypothetical protein
MFWPFWGLGRTLGEFGNKKELRESLKEMNKFDQTKSNSVEKAFFNDKGVLVLLMPLLDTLLRELIVAANCDV